MIVQFTDKDMEKWAETGSLKGYENCTILLPPGKFVGSVMSADADGCHIIGHTGEFKTHFNYKHNADAKWIPTLIIPEDLFKL